MCSFWGFSSRPGSAGQLFCRINEATKIINRLQGSSHRLIVRPGNQSSRRERRESPSNCLNVSADRSGYTAATETVIITTGSARSRRWAWLKAIFQALEMSHLNIGYRRLIFISVSQLPLDHPCFPLTHKLPLPFDTQFIYIFFAYTYITH